MEEWRTCTRDRNYEVSNLGRVRSLDRWENYLSKNKKQFTRFRKGKILSPGTTVAGHKLVVLGGQFSICVHILILEAFVSPCPAGMECLHGVLGPGDNRLENLKWGTRSENMRDEVRRGKATFTLEQAREIKRRYVRRCKINGAVALSREYGVPYSVIQVVLFKGCYDYA